MPSASATRIALVASHAPSLPLFRGHLIAALAARGHKVLCLAPEFDAGTAQQIAGLGGETRVYPLDRTGLSPLADGRSLTGLARIFRDWRPDLVCGYTPKPAIYASLAARWSGVGRIVPMITGLGYAFNGQDGGAGWEPWKVAAVRRATLLLYGRAFAGSHGIIFHNGDDRDVLKTAGVIPAGVPCHVVGGSGVDTEHFRPHPFPAADSGPGSGLVFLMISRLVRYKGILEYCEAAAQLKQQGVRARFLLAGPPESGPSAVTVQEVEGYAGAVEYLGPQSDVRQLIQQCHVYVLPSYGEGLPRTVLEAMAVGRPIITTDARGCRDTVIDGVNGRLVAVAKVSALAAAMRAMTAQPELLPAMAAESRRLVTNRFDVRQVTGHMLSAFGIGAQA